MKTAVTITYFLLLSVALAAGPSGYTDSLHYVLWPLFIAGCVLAVSGRLPKMKIHILWAAFCATSLTHMYRLYSYEKWSAENLSQKVSELLPKEETKTEPNQSLQTTTMAVTDAAAQPPRQP